MNDPETQRLKEEEFLDRFKLVEKFLLFWIPKASMKIEGKPSDQTIDQALNGIVKIYNDSITVCGYDFIIRKRVLRRLWNVIGSSIKQSDDVF
jgi:hypothetical protein